MKTSIASTETPTDDRLYIPADINEAYRTFPAVGRRIRIEYICEYTGMTTEEGMRRTRTRRAIVVQKDKHENGAHFTVEMVPENKVGYKGRYRLSFLFSDLITGRIKVWGVG